MFLALFVCFLPIFEGDFKVNVIDDTEEDYVTDEPVLPKADEQPAKQEEKVETPTVSSFYQRYAEIQKDNPDCIVTYRMGDFYEIMGKKAEQAAEILGLTLTGRNVGLPERVPMCGYPYHVAEPYLESKCEKRIEWKGVCKGENGLSSMSDKDVVEKASEAKNGDKFKRLYAGEDLQNNHSNSDMSLMNILAYWCNGDKEQMLRIFATSGLFRPNKSPDYYEGTAIKALRSMPVKSTYTPTIPKNTGSNGKR